MKLNDKQREVIITIIYVLGIVFMCYCTYNGFSYLSIVLIGIFVLFIAEKIYPHEKRINKDYNTESEIHSLKKWNKDIFYEKVKEKYNIYYEEINKDTLNATIKKYLKVSGIYSFTKNKILIVIETPKVTLHLIEYVEKIKKEFIENIPKSNFLVYQLNIMIITEEINEDLLQDVGSEIFCSNGIRGSMKSISIPIVINERDNKLYISRFNKDVNSEVVAFSEYRRKIRKKLKKKNII